MKFQFANKGKPYMITDSSCGGSGYQKIYYGYYLSPYLIDAKLVKKHFQKGIIFKKEQIETSIELIYCNNNDTLFQNIVVSEKEIPSANEAVDFLQKKISENNADKKRHDDMMASLQKAFSTPDTDETVKVYFDDGTFEEYKTYCTKVSNSDWCLVVEGGKTYHTRYGCFHKWSENYQKSFVAWKAMRTEDAINKGLELCNFCRKADMPIDFDEQDDTDIDVTEDI